MKILVLNGPNLNLLGRREPHIYGSMTLAELIKRLQVLAKELKVTLVPFQSNHEGELVDMMHKHIDSADGALLNPAGLTQFGVSLHDAIKTMPYPVIEVHISNRHAREHWRGHSIISPAAKATVEGLGWRSYTAALRALVEILREQKNP
ncbi:MAG TPA: type II 3-dehydroquinate dehydratase [Burkholderiales bacterium]|nr:type II 3-dehydroquinate dehydratase [Burkholderiales bacterium]